MATDILFPFYEILVNNIFGSVGLSILAIGGIIAVILMLGKTSWVLLTFWMIFYFLVMATMYFGALALVLTFFIIMLYTIISLMRLFAATYLNI